MVPKVGVEPTTFSLQVNCATNCAIPAYNGTVYNTTICRCHVSSLPLETLNVLDVYLLARS